LWARPLDVALLNKNEDPKTVAQAQKTLNKHARHFHVYKRSEMKSMQWGSTPREGDLVAVPESPYSLSLQAKKGHLKGANHGWDP